MHKEKKRKIKEKIIDLYSSDFTARIYTILRLMLSPIIEVAEYVPEKGRILDLGCGAGIFANILYIGSKQRHVLGVDFSAKRIETAIQMSKDNSQLKFVTGDVNDVKIGDHEIITLIDLLHHMPYEEQEDLLKRVHAKLNIGNVLIVKDLEKQPYWKYIFHYIQDSISYKGSKLYFRSSADMERILTETGFDVETISLSAAYPHPHVLYRCTKRAAR